MSRFTGPLGKSFKTRDQNGQLVDPAPSMQYMGQARKLVGELVERIKGPGMNGYGQLVRRIKLADGTIIGAYVQMLGAAPVIRTWVESPTTDESGRLFTWYRGGFLVQPHDLVDSWDDVFIELVFMTSIYSKEPVAKEIAYDLSTKLEAGPVSWCGKVQRRNQSYELVISWDHGMSSRYRLGDNIKQQCSGEYLGLDIDGGILKANSGKRGLYIRGVRFETPYNVVGAGFFQEHVFVISHVDRVTPVDEELTDEERSQIQADLNARCATLFACHIEKLDVTEVDEWIEVGSVRIGLDSTPFRSPWFFSPDGQRLITYTQDSATTEKTVTYHFYEGSITLDKRRGEFVLSVDVWDESYDQIQYNFPYDPYHEETVNEDGFGPGGQYASWNLSDWEVTFTDPTEHAGAVSSIGGFYANCAAWGEYAISQSSCPNTGELNESCMSGLAEWADSFVAAHATDGPTSFLTTPICFSAKCGSNTIGMSLINGVVRRSGSSITRNSQEKFYRGKRCGSAILGVDYGFDGNYKLLTQDIPESIDDDYRWVLKSSTETIIKPVGLDNQSVTILYEYNYQAVFPKHIIRNQLRVGDYLLLELKGELSEPIERSHTKYRKLVSNGSGYDDTKVYTMEKNPSGSRATTQRAWILDADLRNKSVAYVLRTSSGIARATSDPGSWDGIGLPGTIDTVVFDAETDTLDLVVIANDIEYTKSVPTGLQSGISNFYQMGGTLSLFPKLGSVFDSLETYITDSVTIGIGTNALTQYRTMRGNPVDTLPVERFRGSLSVRDPIFTCGSISDSSARSGSRTECFNILFSDQEWIQIEGGLSDAEAKARAANPQTWDGPVLGEYTMNPIRAV